jgi:hypothetical protein
MPTTKAHSDWEDQTAHRPGEQELHIPDKSALTPQEADTLRRKASTWLTQAQREFHDALFAQDGSDESLDRYASARAELDSAEAWALHVSRGLRSH